MKIRRGVFETNSSSVHSLTMCTDNEYDKWQRGDLVYDYMNERLVPISSLSEEEIKQIDDDDYYDFFSFEGYFDYVSSNFETFDESFITPKGEKVIAFGYYGHD